MSGFHDSKLLRNVCRESIVRDVSRAPDAVLHLAQYVHRYWKKFVAYNFRLETIMLGYAVTFLIIALIAGLLGFGLVGGMAYGAAKICFFIFLILAVVALLRGKRLPT
jgi:uncharacterized membrane protein YtjA (UPF0391 family)